MLETIKAHWSWLGIEPTEILATNHFGNVIFVDAEKKFWRICPEELTCEIIANNPDEYNKLIEDDEFLVDWVMDEMVKEAEGKFGEQSEGRCFCLQSPATLGGNYDLKNTVTILHKELLSRSGEMAKKIKDLPDGAEVKL